jgi:hypothetical protein
MYKPQHIGIGETRSSSPVSDRSCFDYAWGTIKARNGRGNIIGVGKVRCSPSEVQDLQLYIWSSWVSGHNGFGWGMWPDSNKQQLSDILIQCWDDIVVKRRDEPDIEAFLIDPLIARRVSTSLNSTILYTYTY